jgi:hypothetical protein
MPWPVAPRVVGQCRRVSELLTLLPVSACGRRLGDAQGLVWLDRKVNDRPRVAWPSAAAGFGRKDVGIWCLVLGLLGLATRGFGWGRGLICEGNGARKCVAVST